MITTTAAEALAIAGGENAFTFSDAKNPAGVHVAVGYDPFRMMSKDQAGKWQYRTENVGQQMTDVIWVETLGLFLAFGIGANVMRSSGGELWSIVPMTNGAWNNACVSPTLGVIIASDRNGLVAKSTDGINFETANCGMALSGCGWSPSLGMFLLVGVAQPAAPGQEQPLPPVMASLDGNTWELLA